MNYIALKFELEPVKPFSEILMAELGELHFNSFVETKKGLEAFILEKDYHKNILDTINILKNEQLKYTYTKKVIQYQNWNANWENSFDPINVEGKCMIKAPFHNEEDLQYNIVIEPKMSFGTGHHETTYLMVKHILNMNLQNKEVLDMGCGTGILAILSYQMKAKTVDAIDIDQWAYKSTQENIIKNNCNDIKVYKGDVSLLSGKNYDLIIANINRNILLNHMDKYVTSLNKNGELLLSGFFIIDEEIIMQECKQKGLSLVNKLEKNNWTALKFRK